MLQICEPPLINDAEVAVAAKMLHCGTVEAYKAMREQRDNCLSFADDDHEVMVHKMPVSGAFPIYAGHQMVVRRKDGEKLNDHWATLQRLKDDIFKNSWAYEVFPPHDHIIDTANTYHLWVFPSSLFKTYSKEEAESLR